MKLVLTALMAVNITFTFAQNVQLEWTHQFGGKGWESGQAIAFGPQGREATNLFVAGQFSDSVYYTSSLGPQALVSAGNTDIFLTRYEDDNLAYAWQFGGPGIDMAQDIALDTAGDLFLTGSFQDSMSLFILFGPQTLRSAGASDIFITKHWPVYGILTYWAVQIGGTGYDMGFGTAVDLAGDVYVTGQFEGTVDFDPGPGVLNLVAVAGVDAFVLKLDGDDGSLIWAKQLGGGGDVAGDAIALDSLGNLYITGYFTGTTDFDPGAGITNFTPGGYSDVFVTKLDPAGDFIWAAQLGGGQSDWARDIAVDRNGNVVTTGAFQSTADFDPGAGTQSLTVVGFNDIFVSKLDAAGNFVWAQQMGGTEYEVGNAVVTDDLNDIYITGVFTQTVDFDPGAGATNLTSAGFEDIYTCALDPSGALKWVKGMGGPDNDQGNDIAVHGQGNTLVTTGAFESSVDFDPDAPVYTLTAPLDTNDAFVHKLSPNGVGIPTGALNALKVFPNPGDGRYTIDLGTPCETVVLTLTDLQGRMLETSPYTHMQTIYLEMDLPAGVYLLSIQADGYMGNVRIVKTEH